MVALPVQQLDGLTWENNRSSSDRSQCRVAGPMITTRGFGCDDFVIVNDADATPPMKFCKVAVKVYA